MSEMVLFVGTDVVMTPVFYYCLYTYLDLQSWNGESSKIRLYIHSTFLFCLKHIQYLQDIKMEVCPSIPNKCDLS